MVTWDSEPRTTLDVKVASIEEEFVLLLGSTPARDMVARGGMELPTLGSTVTHWNVHGPEPLPLLLLQLPWILITWDHLWYEHKDSKSQEQESHCPWAVGGSGSRSPEHFVQCESELEFYWPFWGGGRRMGHWTGLTCTSQFMQKISQLAGTLIKDLIQKLVVKRRIMSHGLLADVWRYREGGLAHQDTFHGFPRPLDPCLLCSLSLWLQLLNYLLTCVFTPTGLWDLWE